MWKRGLPIRVGESSGERKKLSFVSSFLVCFPRAFVSLTCSLIRPHSIGLALSPGISDVLSRRDYEESRE